MEGALKRSMLDIISSKRNIEGENLEKAILESQMEMSED